ncbi:FG-GAP repeat protein [Chitinophaga pinensis]|uniref:VCBS repeat-containing protein n=1 Tax=Chitinophaga pinensis TaxID=79329 RepID=A0A5C6LJ78_9BACT|nr:hypothetical protein FEF09_28340 [Chitinophaga pinensis]
MQVGDVNGDGYPDLLVGTPNMQSAVDEGICAIFLGSQYVPPCTAAPETKKQTSRITSPASIDSFAVGSGYTVLKYGPAQMSGARILN